MTKWRAFLSLVRETEAYFNKEWRELGLHYMTWCSKKYRAEEDKAKYDAPPHQPIPHYASPEDVLIHCEDRGLFTWRERPRAVCHNNITWGVVMYKARDCGAQPFYSRSRDKMSGVQVEYGTMRHRIPRRVRRDNFFCNMRWTWQRNNPRSNWRLVEQP